MNKKFKVPTILSIIFTIAVSMFIPAFAAEVNSVPANIGDTVTYELHVNSCPDKIQALDIAVYYDSNSLELIPYSLELPNISGYMTNTDITGEIRYNAIDFDGFTFDEDKILSKVKFKVIDTSAENLNLSYEIKTFLDSNAVDLKDTYIYDFTSINGRTEESLQSENDSEISTDSETISSDSTTVSDIYSDTDIVESDVKTPNDNPYENSGSDRFENSAISTDSDKSSVNDSSSKSPEQNNSGDINLYLIVSAVSAAVILLIGITFMIVLKRSNNGSHFNKGDK